MRVSDTRVRERVYDMPLTTSHGCGSGGVCVIGVMKGFPLLQADQLELLEGCSLLAFGSCRIVMARMCALQRLVRQVSISAISCIVRRST